MHIFQNHSSIKKATIFCKEKKLEKNHISKLEIIQKEPKDVVSLKELIINLHQCQGTDSKI